MDGVHEFVGGNLALLERDLDERTVLVLGDADQLRELRLDRMHVGQDCHDGVVVDLHVCVVARKHAPLARAEGDLMITNGHCLHVCLSVVGWDKVHLTIKTK